MMTKAQYEERKAEIEKNNAISGGIDFQLKRMALSFETDLQTHTDIDEKAKKKLTLEQIAAAMVFAKAGALSVNDEEYEKLDVLSDIVVAMMETGVRAKAQPREG